MDSVIGYARVSTVEQAATGISLDAQRNRLQAYAYAHGLTLARVEEDAGSELFVLADKRLEDAGFAGVKRREKDGSREQPPGQLQATATFKCIFPRRRKTVSPDYCER